MSIPTGGDSSSFAPNELSSFSFFQRENLERSCLNQFNNQVELSAPGQDIESTVNETTNYGFGFPWTIRIYPS